MNNMGKGMQRAFLKGVLLGGIAFLALAPGRALAQSNAGQAITVPDTLFQVNLVDTSKNDPLLGGEVPLQGAAVRLDVTQDGRVVTGGAAKEGEVDGTYAIQSLLEANGPSVLHWYVQPKGSKAFDFEVPILVAGIPEPGGFLSGWRLWAAVLVGLAALFGAFALGRIGGRRKSGLVTGAGSGLLALALVLQSSPAYAHEGHDDAAKKPGTVYADLKVGFGNLATTHLVKTVGAIRATLDIKVLIPKPVDPNRLTLTDEQSKVLGLQTIVVKPNSLATGLTATGSIQPNPANVATVTSRVAGKLGGVRANVGDRVAAGQVLAVVESLEIADAQAAYGAAQADLITKEANARQALARVSVAERQLSQQRELAKAGVFSQAPLQASLRDKADADADLAAAQADLASHSKALARLQELYDAGIRSKAELEAAQLEHDLDLARVNQARSRVATAQKALEREQTLAGTNVLSRKELVAFEGNLEAAKLEAQQAQSSVASARRALALARGALSSLGTAPGQGNSLQLRSPIGGIVTEREATSGESVRPENALFKIFNPTVVWVEGDVFEKDLSKVSVGVAAQITTDSVSNRSFNGRVSYVAATVNPESRAIRVRVAVPNPDGILRPGMFVQMLFVGGVRAESLTVPEEAVQKDGALSIVYVKEGTAYLRREVSVGETARGQTTIRSGLKAGEAVVTTGAYQLKAMGKA